VSRARVSVRVVGDAPSGLTELLAGLLERNLEREPGRARLLRAAAIVVAATDAGVAARVELRPSTVTLGDARDREPADLRIRATSSDLLAIANAPLALGLPSVLHADGRAVLRMVVTGRVRISGMLRHPVLLSRFARLLSVA
jgi:hypothetical protein